MLSPFHFHYSLHPNVYVAPYTDLKVNIDGDITKDIWKDIPWSTPFDDIRYSPSHPDESIPASDRPNDNCQTRMKMQWDDEYLYIAAILESDFEVRATFQERNEPIYQQDSDFEVFIDPFGSCHDYKEMEMNALNTVWNLMLDRPYNDGGSEHSGRIAKRGDHKFYDVKKQKTAVKLLQGKLNQDGPQRTIWSVEIAMAHSDTLVHLNKRDRTGSFPKEGDMWRMNFSRCEKKGDLNWTWQPQRIWDPKEKAHVGKVNMHLPDAWGYVKFGKSIAQEKFIGQVPKYMLDQGTKGLVDMLWPYKLAVMNVYYAQVKYREENRQYANHVSLLKEYLDGNVIGQLMDRMQIECEEKDEEDTYIATLVFDTENEYALTVDNLRKVQIEMDSPMNIVSIETSLI
ncbi:hypothetical protein CTEN210_12960 [Chaetoceros tenuissimus]|uniref:Carbohydrate-binding domain-containing protein n=1 Tax=Chaetoceros tenuissimus TaxID=426638 RepID=A0AAD3D2H1_9STRA|nr:hypothetical protein CTEN210_12960 [Chaetoceros tenuissimus]